MELLKFFYSIWVLIGLTGASIAILTPMISILINRKNDDTKKAKKLSTPVLIIIIIGIILIIISTLIGISCVKVPNIVGISLSDARNELRKNGLNPQRESNSIETDEDALKLVITQSLDPDSIALKGTTIILTLNESDKGLHIVTYDDEKNQSSYSEINNNPGFNEETNKVAVPDVVDMEQSDAIEALHLSGLRYQVSWSGNSVGDTYYIAEQSYVPGSVVEAGTVIKLTLTNIKPTENVKTFVYSEDDDTVKTYEELNGFYLKTVSTTNGSYYDAMTNNTSMLDYIPMKLCHVIFNVTGAEDSILSISMIDKNTGLCIDNDNGKSELYINKGEYTIMADFGDYSKTVNINITGSGEYDITF